MARPGAACGNSDDERVDLILGLLQAIERVPGQRAYQQALKGLVDALPQPDDPSPSPTKPIRLTENGAIAEMHKARKPARALGL